MNTSDNEFRVLVAIDFGQTGSGCAYAFFKDRVLNYQQFWPRQQVEPRFVLENQHPALAPRPPAQFGPDFATPALDGLLVALGGTANGPLGRPARFLEQPAHVVLVVADAELFRDDQSHAGAGPDLAAEAINLRAMPETLREETLLLGRQPGEKAWAGMGAEGLRAIPFRGGKPLADGSRGDSKGLGDRPPRPTFVFQAQRPHPPPLPPIPEC